MSTGTTLILEGTLGNGYFMAPTKHGRIIGGPIRQYLVSHNFFDVVILVSSHSEFLRRIKSIRGYDEIC